MTIPITSLFLTLLFTACASDVKKADIAATANPTEEVQKLGSDLQSAVSQNVDVLASESYSESMKWYKEGKEDLASEKDQEEILEDVRTGRGYLEKATALANARAQLAPTVLESRQAAISAGAMKHSPLQADLNKVDKALIKESDRFEKTSPARLSELQKNYMDLEKRAVTLNQLGNAYGKLNGAKKEQASKKAPATLKKTELSIKNAESMIAVNVRNAPGYEDAVAKANQDANLLTNVLTIMSQNGNNLSESAALKMVAQNRQIANLENKNAESLENEEALQNKNQQLSSNLASAAASVEVQEAIETARNQFSATEAEVYQQGGNLVIRIKQMDFASGDADIPGNSLPLLAKVSEVAKSLNASQIEVEGHTDSTGSAAKNKEISKERATAVATYFRTNGFENTNITSKGYGFEKPIATNKSKAGRAQNRRVDVVITPSQM